MPPPVRSFQYLNEVVSLADTAAKKFGGTKEPVGELAGNMILLLGAMYLGMDEETVQQAVAKLNEMSQEIGQTLKESTYRDLAHLFKPVS